jgi:hypothetical protein
MNRYVKRGRRVLARDGVGGFAAKLAAAAPSLVRTVAEPVPLVPSWARWRLQGGEQPHELSQLLVPKQFLRPQIGMTTVQEQAYFEWWGAKRYRAVGAVVDLGSWLASTTIPLLEGLTRNAHASLPTVHAFDLWVWEEWMTESVRDTPFAGRRRPGDDFSDDFRERISGTPGRVEIHPGDLTIANWTNGPIELLLVDAMKSWELAEGIATTFYPHLVAGSTVIHQDFSHWFTPWIHILQYRLRDVLDPAYDVPHSGSTVFVARTTPSADRVRTAVRAELEDQEIDGVFGWSESLVAPDKRPRILAAKVKLLAELGARDRGAAALARGRELGGDPELELAAKLLVA